VPVVLPALACSVVATVTSYLYLPARATYLGIPQFHLTWSLMAWALLAGPVIGLVAVVYIRLIGWVSHHAASGRWPIPAMIAAFTSGAPGGLLTPTLSTGAVLGGGAGILWSMAWPGSPTGAYAMTGAAAMLGAGMQAPLASLVLVLELTSSGFQIIAPMMTATIIATVVARHIDGYSIYSARLRAEPGAPPAAE